MVQSEWLTSNTGVWKKYTVCFFFSEFTSQCSMVIGDGHKKGIILSLSRDHGQWLLSVGKWTLIFFSVDLLWDSPNHVTAAVAATAMGTKKQSTKSFSGSGDNNGCSRGNGGCGNSDGRHRYWLLVEPVILMLTQNNNGFKLSNINLTWMGWDHCT